MNDRLQLAHDYFWSWFIGQRSSFVFPVEPLLMTERPISQQGLFLCQGNIEMPFMENLRNMGHLVGAHESQTDPQLDLKRNVRKILLPAHLKADVLKELSLMNINRTTLFPGLDGFARTLGHQLETLDIAELMRMVPAGDLDRFRSSINGLIASP